VSCPVRGLATAAAAAVLALTGCTSGAAERPPGIDAAASAGSVGPAVRGELTVLAASSLTEAFTRISADFEAANPGTSVTVSFGGSTALARQISFGAPGDLFAAASRTAMDDAVARLDGDPVVFARNRLQIAVPAGNPAGVKGLADLAREDLLVALCAEQVPCGEAAARAFAAAAVEPAPDTLEQDVKAVLTKTVLGEVDAALVYRTDVLAAGDAVEGIDFPESEQAVNDYLIGHLGMSTNRRTADEFLRYLQSPPGRKVLAEAGFERP
jgi:molybdate transport system substrate-binding protein